MDTQKIIKKHLGIRFGSVTIQKEFTTKNQILKALEIQLDEDLSTGYYRPIGQILIDSDLISPLQRDEVIEILSKEWEQE